MSGDTANDSVPLTELAGPPAAPPAAPHSLATNFKILLSLFLSFILVVSDGFTNCVLSGFGENAVKGRTPTPWGVALQGIFLVISFSLAKYLIKHGVL